MIITEPGAYPDVPEDVYHRDPIPVGSLSASGAKKLVAPYTPAHFHYEQTHPSESSRAMDLGTAAHYYVLGVGPELVMIDHKDYKTKAAQEARAAAKAEGKVPLLKHEMAQVQAMAARLREHGLASALLEPADGWAELSLFGIDPDTGVWRRCRIDFLRAMDRDGLVRIIDYKSCISAHSSAVRKRVYDMGYFMQAPWYVDVVALLGLSPHREPVFSFIFQEKEPPYEVQVVELEPEAMTWGRKRNRAAIETYQRCKENDEWPGFDETIIRTGLPVYAEYELIAAEDRGEIGRLADYEEGRV